MSTVAAAGAAQAHKPVGMQAYFQRRSAGDELDVLSVLYDGLRQGGKRAILDFEGDIQDGDRIATRVAALQDWLRRRGLVQGDRVAVMLNNSMGHIALIYALMLSGLVWVPVNTRLRGAGLQHILRHCRPALVISEPAYREEIDEAGIASERVAELSEGLQDASPAALRRATVKDTDVLCLLYTSGTTGMPKGVMFTHRMMRIATESALIVADVRPGDRLFVWEPFCHIGGAQMLLLPFLQPVMLNVVERFSISRFWSQWRRAGSTHLHYLGGVMDMLSRIPKEEIPADVRVQVAWGAGLSADVWRKVVEQFGCRIRECYGMTECSSFATYNAAGSPGVIGKPLPWITAMLCDDEGREVERGQIGEIVLSTDLEGAFFPGYLDNPEATRGARIGNRLHTGDLGRQDENGDFMYVGRRNDSMRVRGENVSAWEVERVFMEHEAVQSCAAVGVSAQIGEQEILLYVQFKDGCALPWQELAQWAHPKLASFQLPRFYKEIDRFELTLSERIRKHLLDKDTAGAWDRKLNS